MIKERGLVDKLQSFKDNDFILLVVESAQCKYAEITDENNSFYKKIGSVVSFPLEYPLLVLGGYLFKKSLEK